MKELYFAYGANTNATGMSHRCPKAKPIGAFTLPERKLVFRYVADVVHDSESEVHGALWELTPACELALDYFEGYPHLYDKAYYYTVINGEPVRVMYYQMVRQSDEAPPSASYENCLRAGYKSFGLPHLQIDEAIANAGSGESAWSFSGDRGSQWL